MDLQTLRQKLSQSGFSEEVALKLDEIMGRVVMEGNLSDQNKTAMMELIDLDIDAGNLEAEAMENMAVLLDSYASEADGAVKAIDAEEEKIADDADREAAALEAEIAQVPVTLPTAPVVGE